MHFRAPPSPSKSIPATDARSLDHSPESTYGPIHCPTLSRGHSIVFMDTSTQQTRRTSTWSIPFGAWNALGTSTPVISIVVERLTGTSIAPSSRRRLLRFRLLRRRIEGNPRVIGKTGSKTDEETVERYPGDPSSSPPCHDGGEAGN